MTGPNSQPPVHKPGTNNANTVFTHPGLLNSAAELAFLRRRVHSGAQPWTRGYAGIPDFRSHRPQPVAEYRDGAGHKQDRHDINMQRLIGDARAAYGSALHGIITQSPVHARKAAEILNAWSATLRRIDSSNDGSLSTSYGWPCLIYAAEILRHVSATQKQQEPQQHWSQGEQERFRETLVGLVWPATQRAADKDNGNNHRSFALLCRLAIAVHVDERGKFEETLSALRGQIPHYVYADGQCLETPRDLWHAQMGIAPLVAAAEIAWHQGVDLYGQDKNRLLVGTEWHVPFVLGQTPGWPRRFTSPEKKYQGGGDKPVRGGGGIWPFFEMVCHHYHGRRGLPTPHTARLLAAGGRRPEKRERTGGWGTLTHAHATHACHACK
jgi:hypothetical protein